MRSGPQRLSGCIEPPDTEGSALGGPIERRFTHFSRKLESKEMHVFDSGGGWKLLLQLTKRRCVRDVTRSTYCVLSIFFLVPLHDIILTMLCDWLVSVSV